MLACKKSFTLSEELVRLDTGYNGSTTVIKTEWCDRVRTILQGLLQLIEADFNRAWIWRSAYFTCSFQKI